jgi:hypothetical protein
MEALRNGNEAGVGIGTILEPGSYTTEGEVLLLRVRLNNRPLICLIDGERRVREIVAVPASMDLTPPTGGRVAYDAGRTADIPPCQVSDVEKNRLNGVTDRIVSKFEVLLQRYAADGRSCLRKMAAVLDRRNLRLLCEFRDGGAPGLKAYLVRELFKRTVREERGFKILLLLSQVIAINGGSQPERLEMMTLEQQKQLLREFMDFLKIPGHKRIDPRIFQEIYDKFDELEYANLNRGGVGFFIKPLYIQEMKELKSAMTTANNSNYLEQLFSNSNREPLDFLFENSLAYLKALAIVRLYAKSNRKERGGDSKIIVAVLRDLIAFRPAWVKTAGQAPALTA